MKHRYKPEVRKTMIITAALDAAERVHYLKLTRELVAEAADVSSSAIQYHFKTMGRLRSEVMRAAVKQERLAVIAQGLTSRDGHARKASEELQARALADPLGGE